MYWIENGQGTWLELSFESDGETWTVNPAVRCDAPFRTPREPGRPEPASSAYVGFDAQLARREVPPLVMDNRPQLEVFHARVYLPGWLDQPVSAPPGSGPVATGIPLPTQSL